MGSWYTAYAFADTTQLGKMFSTTSTNARLSFCGPDTRPSGIRFVGAYRGF